MGPQSSPRAEWLICVFCAAPWFSGCSPPPSSPGDAATDWTDRFAGVYRVDRATHGGIGCAEGAEVRGPRFFVVRRTAPRVARWRGITCDTLDACRDLDGASDGARHFTFENAWPDPEGLIGDAPGIPVLRDGSCEMRVETSTLQLWGRTAHLRLSAIVISYPAEQGRCHRLASNQAGNAAGAAVLGWGLDPRRDSLPHPCKESWWFYATWIGDDP